MALLFVEAVNDIHPMTTNLIRRKVDISPTCPMCDMEVKTTMHVFCTCYPARQVWLLAQLPIHSMDFACFVVWLKTLFACADEDVIAVVVAIFHSIWSTRNKMLWDKATSLPKAIWNHALGTVQAKNNSCKWKVSWPTFLICH